MPIRPSSPITVFSQDEFYAVDEVVKGHSFDIHNQLGRFLDEKIYQNELAFRLEYSGFLVEREVKVTVSLGDFFFDYYIDLLVNGGVIIETKAARALDSTHRAQVLNYLFLCGLQHASLINFRPERVEYEFVSTTMDFQTRQEFKVNTELWQPLTPRCGTLIDLIQEALTEWGRGLNITLYRDYVAHELGGIEKVVREVPVVTQNGVAGKQQVYLLSENVAFAITAITRKFDSTRKHQHRFLSHTNLSAIQWINMDRETIYFETITKQ